MVVLSSARSIMFWYTLASSCSLRVIRLFMARVFSSSSALLSLAAPDASAIYASMDLRHTLNSFPSRSCRAASSVSPLSLAKRANSASISFSMLKAASS